MKVLVLGAEGMLGKDLIPILSAKGEVWLETLAISTLPIERESSERSKPSSRRF